MDQNRVNITVTATDKGATATLKDIEATGKKTATSWGALRGSILAVSAAIGVVALAQQAWNATIGDGFARKADLEDANKRLKQMGLEIAEIDALSKSLQDTLVGTPYALNDGANAMARLVSAGVGLETVPGVFEDIVDAAAFAQRPVEDVANLFVKIQSGGKLTGDILNEMATRGLPALALLSDAAGVTGAEFREMVKRSEISADEFFELWSQGAQGFGEDSLKIEGAAQSMGDTTRGAMANAGTAFARLGANLLEEVWPAFRKVADGAKDVADGTGRVVDFFQENRIAGAALVGVLSLVAGNMVAIGVTSLVTAARAVGSFIAIKIAAIQMAIAIDGAAGGFKYLLASLGPVGVAFAVAGAALSLFMSRGGESAKVNQQLVDSLDDVTGALTKNSREIVFNSLVESGAVDMARKMGVGLDTLTDAALGNADAIAEIRAAQDEYNKTLEIGATNGEKSMTNWDNLTDAIGVQNTEVTNARAAWEAHQEAMGNAGAEAANTGGMVEDLTEEQEANAEATDVARQAIEGYQEALRAATDPVFAMVSALGKVQKAQTDYDGAVAAFGGTSAEATQAAVDLAKANLEASAAANDADLNFAAFTEQLNGMVAAGQLTAEQANLIRQSVDGARQSAEAFDSDYVADVRANIDATSIREAESALSWLARQRQSQINPNVLAAISRSGKRTGGIVGHAAEGGPRNGPTLVGEDGPEIRNLAAGDHITPAGKTAQILGQGGGGTMVLRIESGGSRMDDLLVELIRKAVRAGGGDVQVVLGT